MKGAMDLQPEDKTIPYVLCKDFLEPRFLQFGTCKYADEQF